MKKSLIKIISLLIIIGLNWTWILATGSTFAYFSDTKIFTDNTFQTAVLDMTLRSGQNNFVPGADSMKPGDQVNRDIYIGKTASSLALRHNVSFEFISGDANLCDQLDLKIWYDHYHGPVSGGYANRDMRLTYSGKLSALTNYSHSDFEVPHPDDRFDTDPSDGTEQWFYYSIILPYNIADSFQGKVCNFKFVFDGWQANLPDSSQGFTDTEEIANLLQSGKWIAEPGDVVINELMWMGSWFRPFDEWIELRNMTSYPIDLSGWQLTKLVYSGEKLMLEIPTGNIPANGYFLISNFSKDNSRINVDPHLVDSSVALRNRNLQIKLYKGNWQDSSNLIDTADDGQGRPLAGWHGFLFHLSMERDDVPGDGTLASSWHTCLDFVNSRIYWDPGDKFNLGTPGAQNLSDEEDINLEYYIQLEQELLAEGIYLPDLVSEEENYDEEEIPEIPVEEESPVDEEILLNEEPVIEEEPAEEISVIEGESIGEEVTTEENQEQEGIIEEINEIIDEVIDGIVDEIMPDEIINEPTEKAPVEETETPVIEDVPMIEEALVDETPEVEEQPAVVPDDSFSNPDGAGESVSDGGSGDGAGDTSGSLDNSSPAKSAGESSGGSGIDTGGEIVSE